MASESRLCSKILISRNFRDYSGIPVHGGVLPNEYVRDVTSVTAVLVLERAVLILRVGGGGAIMSFIRTGRLKS